MLLSIAERCVLLQILPEKGDYATMRIVSDLRREVGFSEEEANELGMKTEDGRTTWAENKEKDLNITPRSMGIICDALIALDKAKGIAAPHLEVYEKFLLNDGKSDAGTDSRHPATAVGS